MSVFLFQIKGFSSFLVVLYTRLPSEIYKFIKFYFVTVLPPNQICTELKINDISCSDSYSKCSAYNKFCSWYKLSWCKFEDKNWQIQRHSRQATIVCLHACDSYSVTLVDELLNTSLHKPATNTPQFPVQPWKYGIIQPRQTTITLNLTITTLNLYHLISTL